MNEVVKYQAKRSDDVNSPQARGVYAYHLFEKRTKRANGKPCTPHRDLTLAFPKTNADATQCANYKFLSELCMQAVAREPQWSGQWPAGGVWPIKDGDVPYVAKPKPGITPLTSVQIEEKYGWRKGHWIVEVTNYLDPGPKISVLKNGTIQEIPAQTVNGVQYYKSGDYCIVNMSAYTYWNEQAGVNFSFSGVLWVAEGQQIGGNSGPKSTEQMFGSVAPVASVMPAVNRGPSVQPPIPSAPPAMSAAPVMPAPVAAPVPPQPVYAQPSPAAYPAPVAPAVALPGPPMPTMAAPPPPGMPGLPPIPGR
ncbi:hypothetical protein [Bradyrhizobium liaoningense]